MSPNFWSSNRCFLYILKVENINSTCSADHWNALLFISFWNFGWNVIEKVKPFCSASYLCWQVVCSNCSDNRAPLEYLRNKSMRVCDECFQKLQTGTCNFTKFVMRSGLIQDNRLQDLVICNSNNLNQNCSYFRKKTIWIKIHMYFRNKMTFCKVTTFESNSYF